MACNSLPDFIRDPTSSTDCFRRPLKTYFSRVTSASSALGVLNDYALYKSTHSLTHSHRAGHLSLVEVRSGRERSGGKCPTNSLGSKWGALPLPLRGVYVHRHQTAAAAAASHIPPANVNKRPFKTNRRHYAINRPRPWETGCIRRVLTSHRRTTVPGPPCQCPRR